MKKGISLLLMVVVLLTTMLTGCSNGNTTESAVSLVLGNHKYFPKINLHAETIYQKIYDAAYSYGDCSVIVVDGNPYVGADYNIKKPDANIDDTKRRQISKQNTEQIIAESTTMIAKTSEIDTLSAIDCSSALLKSSSAEVKEMLVYDSGLSTIGLLDFSSENIIDVDPILIVERLSELHALPKLSGINVVWTGLGEVCGEQDELPSTYKYKLENIWRAIIEAAGGTVEFVNVPLSTTQREEVLPSCKTVPIINDSLNLSGDVIEPIKFSEDTIKFVGDKAIYIDEDTAKDALEPIGKFLVSNPEKNIVILGTTATIGSESSCLNLSLNRAETCKKTLIEMGASPNQIDTIGLGRKKCFLRVDDVDSNGELIEELASQNRAVFIFDSDSYEAVALKKI